MTLGTGFFLVFAGMALGYAVWHRDRREDQVRLKSLGQENQELRSTIKLARTSHEKLSERFTRQKGQLNVLQQLCDDWSASRDQSEQDRAQLELEITQTSHRYELAAAELKEEKQRRIQLEDENHRQNQQKIESLSAVEKDWRVRLSRSQSVQEQQNVELANIRIDNARLTEQLHDAQAAIATLNADLTSQRSLLETATKNASGFEQEYVSIESALNETNEQLKQSAAQCAVAQSAQKVAEESLASLQESYKNSQSQISELTEAVAEIESLESHNEALQQSLKNSAEQLKLVVRQRDHALDETRAKHAEAMGFQKRSENQEATIQAMRQKHDESLENLKLEIEKRADLEQAYEQQLAELEIQIDDHSTQMESQSNELANQFEIERAELKETVAKKELANAELTQQLGERQSELESAKQDLVQSQSQMRELTSKVEELKTTCLRISQLENLVQRRDAQDGEIVEELATLRKQMEDAHEQHQRLKFDYDRLCDEQNTREDELTGARSELATLRLQVTDSQETIHSLRTERAALMARLANRRKIAEPDSTVISFTEAMLQRQREAIEYDAEYLGPTSVHANRGIIYTEPPEKQDDLKMISGIAEVLEARLNDYGIYTFKQIRDWQPKTVLEFSRLIGFKERIDRDDWVGQAKRLYDQKMDNDEPQKSVA